MSWLSDKLKEIIPYAMVALPFTPWGAGLGTLMQTKAPWMANIMKSKFMNSILGAGLKDATLKYALAKAQDKENPHLIAKDALLRNMFLNAYKVGFDPNLMMGEDIPGIKKYAENIASDYNTFDPPLAEAPFDLSQNVMPNVQATPSFMDIATDYTHSPANLDLLKQSADAAKRFEEASLAKQLLAKEALVGGAAGATQSLPFEYIEGEKNPLAGLGYMTTTKTEPSRFERLLGKVKEAKEAGIERGSDEWNEMFDIGATRPDPAWVAGTIYDYFRDPLTEHDIQEDEDEKLRRKMEKMMWPRSMADIYDFEGRFGVNRGGLASLANGGRIGYQGGGIGPAGMRLEETPMAARKDVTIKSQLEDLYKLYMEKGLLTPGLAKLLGWDDPNQYYNNELWQRDFGDPDTSFMNEPTGRTLFGTMEEMGIPFDKTASESDEEKYRKYMDEMAYDPEGAGPMTPIAPIDFDDDFIFDEGTIGQEPTFADEFEGYLDLAGGTDDIRAEIQSLQSTILMEQDPERRKILEIRLDELLGQLGTTSSAARGGRMGYYGGGDLNAIPGGMVSGPGSETSDSVPAQLSNNEFVVTADAVRAAGGGDIDLGAQKFYGIMNALDPNSARPGEPPVYS
jgi:hypothetical protein